MPTAQNTFCGTPAAQIWNDLAVWEEFLNRHAVKSLIELGTWKGGMAAFLAVQCLARDIVFTTVDSNAYWLENKALIEQLGGKVVNADVFDLETMRALIKAQPTPLLLFCDNGDKRRELREIAPILSDEDLVAVHDWGSEAGPADIPETWRGLLISECEATMSLTRFFSVEF